MQGNRMPATGLLWIFCFSMKMLLRLQQDESLGSTAPPAGKGLIKPERPGQTPPTSHRDAWLGQGQGARGWLCSSPVTLQRRRDPGGTCPSLPDAQARGLVQSLPALQLGQQPLKR